MAKDQDTYTYFEGSVAKISRDGDEVLSDHLAPGERLKADVDNEKREQAADKRGDKQDEKRDEKRDDAGKKGDRDHATGEVKTVTETNSGKAQK